MHRASLRPTAPAPATLPDAATPSDPVALAAANATTWPPMSSSRAQGIAWYCALMSTARSASGDAARFAAPLEGL